MTRFGIFTINGKAVGYALTCDCDHGLPVYVASLAENPAVRFVAVRQDLAIERLREHLMRLAQPVELPWLRPASAAAGALKRG